MNQLSMALIAATETGIFRVISVLLTAVRFCYSSWTNSESTRLRHSFRPGGLAQSAMAKNLDSFIPTRRSLLSRLKNPDDQESWKDFFGIYWKLIYGVALKAGLTAVEAQEVAQETFIVVAKKMPDFKYDPAIGSFKSWLLHTTQWRIADQFRKRRKERAGGGRPSQTTRGTATMERIPDPAGFKLEEIWDAEWEKNLFDAALQRVKHQVKASHYQLFDLYVIKQWPVQKVAEALGVTIGQVYLAKHRISGLLKKELKLLNRQIA